MITEKTPFSCCISIGTGVNNLYCAFKLPKANLEEGLAFFFRLVLFEILMFSDKITEIKIGFSSVPTLCCTAFSMSNCSVSGTISPVLLSALIANWYAFPYLCCMSLKYCSAKSNSSFRLISFLSELFNTYL